ncbi:IcmT/TraK family protein [Acidithiobacillus ferrooxidans]|uniref:IcmT/TraK family protein n=1 Tax=Acidithiobacillus ferrooxidans TaxID=920 RepID=UPI00214B9EB8|nr:IcmT/TraK family protein [Acidithiobacillus ferrooxidans]MCR2831126.1 IcmT/TraK family protein [Acidithiobacillus ferrooxidans]
MARVNTVANEINAWRYRSLIPKFFFIDGQAFWPILLCFIHPALVTLEFAVVSMLTLHFAARRGYGPGQLIGKLRSFLASRYRYRE